MTELEKAFAGESFDRRDGEVVEYQAKVKKLLYDFNRARPNDPERAEIIKQLVTGYSEWVFIEDGFRCVFGKNIHFKGMAIINFGCTFLDSDIITVGDRALIGPNCNIICTNHALDAEERLKGGFCDKPVVIGDKTWLGANVTVLPGVTIGEGAVIGAGSVITKDIPPYTVAAGNPCRVIKQIPKM